MTLHTRPRREDTYPVGRLPYTPPHVRGWRTRKLEGLKRQKRATQEAGTQDPYPEGLDVPLFIAAYPNTIAMLLISSTKVLTEVVGMLKTSWGKGPTRLWPR